MRYFIDSSVLYAAFYSTRGHSFDLLQMAARKEVQLVVSEYVMIETRRNLAEDLLEEIWFFDLVMARVPFEYVRPTKSEVERAAKLIVLKDAPVVAAARKAKVDVLVTLDKKHLLGKPDLVKYVKAPILTPQEIFKRLSKSD